MENFILIPQTGCPKKDPKARRLARAHVARQSWQKVKAQARPPCTPHKLFSKSRSGSNSHSGQGDNSQTSKNRTRELSWQFDKRKPQPFNKSFWLPIGRASDVFVYAGSYLESTSYGFFKHYGAEFRAILCDSVQPIHVTGPAICCTQAVQLNSPTLLHAICYQGAAHEAVIQARLPVRRNMFKDPDNYHGLEANALYHKSKALHFLRELVEGQSGSHAISESSVLCVTILLAAEAMMGHKSALESHMSGLRQLVVACGGLSALSPHAATLVRLTDVKAAIAGQMIPLYQSLYNPKDQSLECSSLFSSSSVRGEKDIVNTSLGLMKPSLRQQLCPALYLCIFNARHLTLAVSETRENYPTIDEFVELEHSLISLKRRNDMTTLENVVRIALLLFTNTALWRTPIFFNWIETLVMELRAALELLDWQTTIERHSHVLLWVAMLGRYATRVSTVNERCWWSKRIRSIAMSAELTSFREVRSVLSGLFFVEEVYGSTWEQIWNEDVSGASVGDGSQSREECGPSHEMEYHPCSYHQRFN